MLLPLIKKIKDNNEHNVIVFALTTAFQYFHGMGIECVRYMNFTHLSVTDDWEQFGIQAIGAVDDYTGRIPYEESLAYHGINYADLVSQLGIKKAKLEYHQASRACFHPINFMRNVLECIEPNLVVATNSPRSERSIIEASNVLGIKSICLVDLFATFEYHWISRPHFATKVLVLNDSVKSFLVSKGRNENDIVITGNPAFDSIYDDNVLEVSKKLGANKYKNNKINILFASQIEPKTHPLNGRVGDVDLPKINEKMVRDLVKENDDYRLIIRYHPSQNVPFQKAKNVVLSPRDEPLHCMLHCMDIVVVSSSTVGLEAYLAGKKVITIETGVFFPDDCRYSEDGISLGVKSKDQLLIAIQELTVEIRQGVNQKKHHDLATPKICYVIEQLLLDA